MTTTSPAVRRPPRQVPSPPGADRPGAARGPARRAAVAAGLFVLGVVLVLGGAGGAWSSIPWETDPRWSLLPLAVTCAAVLLPRERPVPALLLATAGLAGDAALGGNLGVVLAFVDVLHSSYLGLADRGRRTLETTATAVVLTLCAVTALDGGLTAALGMLLSAGALLLVPLWWARDVHRTAELARLDADRHVRDERAAMARDLHDVLAGHLSAIALQSEAALAAARAAGQDTTVLTGIRAASVESLSQMRTMIHLMRSTAPAPATAAPGLAEVPRTVALAAAAGLDVQLVGARDLTGPTPPDVAPAVGHAVHRVLQEALTNARKHSDGPVRVRLTLDNGDVTLTVVSTGQATTAPRKGRGHGLLTMRERTEALGGTFHAGPDGAGGWCVRATLPAAGPVHGPRPARRTARPVTHAGGTA